VNRIFGFLLSTSSRIAPVKTLLALEAGELPLRLAHLAARIVVVGEIDGFDHRRSFPVSKTTEGLFS
jgi:hypothetical protein